MNMKNGMVYPTFNSFGKSKSLISERDSLNTLFDENSPHKLTGAPLALTKNKFKNEYYQFKIIFL